MIAYSRFSIRNAYLLKKATKWYSHQLIRDDQMLEIVKTYDNKYSRPTVFIKIGLFLFTLLIVAASLGLYSLLMMGIMRDTDNPNAFGIISCTLFAGACIFFLEKFIKEKKWYKNGVDQALLYCALAFIYAAIRISFEDHLRNDSRLLVASFIYLPFLILALLRYLDRLVTCIGIVHVFLIAYLAFLNMGIQSNVIFSILLMLVAAFILLFSNKLLKNHDHFYYHDCLRVTKFITLLVLYSCGNYFVSQDYAAQWMLAPQERNLNSASAILFFSFTALIPLVMIFWSLKRKDKLLLWVGLIVLALSVLTFKTYFSLGHPEISLSLAGLIMIGLSWLAMRYLKTDKFGISFKEEVDENNYLKSNIEALLVAQNLQSQNGPSEPNIELGGGQFGGGGSGQNF